MLQTHDSIFKMIIRRTTVFKSKSRERILAWNESYPLKRASDSDPPPGWTLVHFLNFHTTVAILRPLLLVYPVNLPIDDDPHCFDRFEIVTPGHGITSSTLFTICSVEWHSFVHCFPQRVTDIPQIEGLQINLMLALSQSIQYVVMWARFTPWPVL